MKITCVFVCVNRYEKVFRFNNFAISINTTAYCYKTFIYTHIPSKRKFACCITLCVRTEASASNLFSCVHLHVLFDRIMLECIEALRLQLKKHSYLQIRHMLRPKCECYLENCCTYL